MTYRHTDRPVVTLDARYADFRWTGTTVVNLTKGQVIGVDDLVGVLTNAGCSVLDVADDPGAYRLEVAPSPLIYDTLAQTCRVDGRGVHAKGGPQGAIVPWVDPAAVRHDDRVLGRDTGEWDRQAEQRAYLAWFSGEGPMPERAREMFELEELYVLPHTCPGDYRGTGAEAA